MLRRSKITPVETLAITVDHSTESTTLHLKGHVGIDSSPALRDQLLAVLEAQVSKIVTVDLTDVPYIDTSGIATLIEALKVARSRRTKLCVNGLQSRLVRLFEATGLIDLLEAGCSTSASSELKVN